MIPRRLKFICRRFGTLCLFHLHRQLAVLLNELKQFTYNVTLIHNLYRCTVHLDINAYVHQQMHLFISLQKH